MSAQLMTFSVDNIPSRGMVRIWLTADVITSESAEQGEADRQGWLSSFDSTSVEESRNDVEPLFEAKAEDIGEDELQEIADIVARLGGYETEDGVTLYASDIVTLDYSTDEAWSYCLHGELKSLKPNAQGDMVWTEEEFVIVPA